MSDLAIARVVRQREWGEGAITITMGTTIQGRWSCTIDCTDRMLIELAHVSGEFDRNGVALGMWGSEQNTISHYERLEKIIERYEQCAYESLFARQPT